MEIRFDTKYNIGQDVWFVNNNRIESATVSDIALAVTADKGNGGAPVMSVNYVAGGKLLGEDEMFGSVDGLLWALLDDCNKRYCIIKE
jgi:hypothetical protein